MAENQQAKKTFDTLLEQARGIARMAAERTQAIDRQRRLPEDLITAIKDSGLFRIMQPSHWGNDA